MRDLKSSEAIFSAAAALSATPLTYFLRRDVSDIAKRVIQAGIGAPAPSVNRQPLPSAAVRPADPNQRIHTRRDGSLLPAGKIAALLRFDGSKHFRARGRVVISAIAGMSNLSRETVYQARRGIMSERTRALLSRTISAIERGEVTSAANGKNGGSNIHPIPALRRGLWFLTRTIHQRLSSGSTTAILAGAIEPIANGG